MHSLPPTPVMNTVEQGKTKGTSTVLPSEDTSPGHGTSQPVPWLPRPSPSTPGTRAHSCSPRHRSTPRQAAVRCTPVPTEGGGRAVSGRATVLLGYSEGGVRRAQQSSGGGCCRVNGPLSRCPTMRLPGHSACRSSPAEFERPGVLAREVSQKAGGGRLRSKERWGSPDLPLVQDGGNTPT